MRTLPLAAALCLAALPATAQRLPAGVTPTHYTLWFAPDLEKETFRGRETIAVTLAAPATSITLHAAEISFGEVTVTDEGGAQQARVTLDDTAETATFTVPRAVRKGPAAIHVAFTGMLNDKLRGFYLSRANGRKYAVSQMEATDARRAFPSFDEPAFKATFEISLMIDAADTAISNGRQLSDTPGPEPGKHTLAFATTPKMSTYLVALLVGDFVCRAGGIPGTPIRVCATPDKLGLTAFALSAAEQQVAFFNEYFGIPYPYGKLDIVGIPDFAAGAMENAGAITFRERLLLADEATSSVGVRRAVASVVAHEIAHQWFGNLVTMAWWDDLWLNEGFATWMEGRTTRKLHPEWDTDSVDAAFTSRGAMGQDAFATTHPVVQHVATVEQASQAFDGITYGKGSAVISMLEDYVGETAWRNGVRSYIGKHAYGNAVTDDLWAEIEQAAPGKQFAAVAHDFTLQPGVPLIKASSACVDGSTRVQLEQGEYTVDRPDKTPLRWRVPVNVRGGDGKAVRVLVDGKASVTLPGCDTLALVNAGQKGYFRTLYAPAQFKALRSGFAGLPVVDQMGLMLDTGALAAVGLQPESDSLDLAMQVPADAAPELWQMVAGSVGGLDDLFKGDAKRQDAIHAFAIKRLAPKFAQLGWDNRAGDSAATRQLRNTLISTLGGLGDAAVLVEARRRFDAFLADPASLSPDLRRTVLGMVARNADVATWERLHALARQEKSSMLRDQYYGLLARAKDKALAQRALDMTLTDEPGATNGAGMISAVSWEHPELAFDFAAAHREQVDKLVDSTSRARFYPGLGSSATDLSMVEKINAFAEAHIAPTSRRDAERVVNGIQTRVKLRQQRLPQVDAWLKQQGV